MISLSFQFGPYSFLGVLLSLLGLINLIFLLRFEHKTPLTWYWIAMLAGFTISMMALFLSVTLVVWGYVFASQPWIIFSMTAAIGLIYHYPEKNNSREVRLFMGVGIGATVLAFGYCFYDAWQVLINHNFNRNIHPLYSSLEPIMFMLTLGLSIRRTLLLHWAAVGRREIIPALLNPHPSAYTLRNISIGLFLGSGQGLASILGNSGVLPVPFDMYGIGFFLLALVVVQVYCSWDHATHQPDLIVKLISLTLVTLQTALGAVGLMNIHNAVLQSESRLLQNVEIAQWAVRVGDLSNLPAEIEYIVAYPDSASLTRDARLVYERDPNRITESLLTAIQSPNKPVIWGYYYDYYLTSGRPQRAANLYTGDHPQNSYNQYVGYTFRGDPPKPDPISQAAPQTYEVIFDLTTANFPVHSAGLVMTGVIFISNLFILVIFPLFFRSKIITPLNRLLQGVTQANTGDLSVAVPVLQNDEIGFLTQSFNAMIASIQTQIDARQQKETALQELTNTLEQRVASRTRELAVLYDISAAASQAQTITTLLTRSLTQTMTALDSDLGAVYLVDDLNKDQRQDATPRLKKIACQGIYTEIENMPATLPTNHGLLGQLFRDHEPLLVFDLTTDARIPKPMQDLGRRSFLAAPLRADDRVLGVLMLIHKIGKTFSAEEVALLSSIADQVGFSVQSSYLRQQTVVLEERQHLAQDLHDSVTQVLYGLVTLAEAGQVRLTSGSKDAIQITFERIATTARQALNEMRLFVHRLRPSELDQQGLAVALSQRVAAVEGWSGVRIRLLVDETIRLPSEVEDALYQIAQEALNNALRHAHAGMITLKLQNEAPYTLLEISDDGRGFDPEQIQRGLGLASMTERARAIHATFEVITHPGEGTQIRARVS
jgi:signal transduction histidine kinase